MFAYAFVKNSLLIKQFSNRVFKNYFDIVTNLEIEWNFLKENCFLLKPYLYLVIYRSAFCIK